MKLLTPDEKAKYEVKSGIIGNPVVKEVYKTLGNMTIGQSLLVEKSEWPLKNAPNPRLAHNRQDGRTFRLSTLKDESGWIITRVG